MRKIYTFILSVAACLAGLTATAQTPGYNRLQNTTTGHVVNLASSSSFAPSATMEEAYSLAGTVAYLDFDGNRVASLKAQNVDLVNVVIPMIKNLIPQVLDEETFIALRDSTVEMVRENLGGAMGTLLVGHLRRYTYDDFLDYLNNIDTNMYMQEADGGFYLYYHSPAFPIDAGDFNSYFTSKINSYIRLYVGTMQDMAAEYLVGREELMPMVNSMISHMRFGDYLYLAEENDEEFGPQFAFTNSQDHQMSGMNEVWNFLPIDNDENYFGLRGQYQDADGKWYASFAADFPVKLASGMTAYCVTDVVDGGKSMIQRKKIEADVIPALTPMIVQLNGESTADNKLHVVDREVSNVIDGNALQLATDSLGFLLGKRLPKPDKRYYVLGIMEGKVSLVETEETFLVPNEAILFLDNNTKDRNLTGYLILSDNVDGIEEHVTTNANSGKYFDLQGRQVAKPVRGIYILNGKKVVIK